MRVCVCLCVCACIPSMESSSDLKEVQEHLLLCTPPIPVCPLPQPAPTLLFLLYAPLFLPGAKVNPLPAITAVKIAKVCTSTCSKSQLTVCACVSCYHSGDAFNLSETSECCVSIFTSAPLHSSWHLLHNSMAVFMHSAVEMLLVNTVIKKSFTLSQFGW